MPSITAIKLLVTLSCQDDGFNQVHFDVIDGDLVDPENPTYYSHVLDVDGALHFGPYGPQIDWTFYNINNGEYTCWVEDNKGRKSNTVIRYGSCRSVEPPPVCDVVFNPAPPAAMEPGDIFLNATTSADGLQIRISPSGTPGTNWQNAPSGVSVNYSVSPGSYTIQARDGRGCLTPVYTLQVATQAIMGCTDPTALNYDPNATSDDGTCEYKPGEVWVYYDIPMMNSLRFTQPAYPDGLYSFATQDNTPECEYKLRGEVKIPYLQKVINADIINIQILSNLPEHRAEVFDLEGNLLGTMPVKKVLSNTDKSSLFTTFIRKHNETQTRVYFDESLFNFNVEPSQILELRNAGAYNGRYTMQGIDQETPGSSPFFIINRAFTGPGETLGVTVFAEYNVAPFDVYEATFTFSGIPAGTCYAKITGIRGGFEFPAFSEPIDVQFEHPGAYYIRYRNNDPWCDLYYTTGLVHMLRVDGNLWHHEPGIDKKVHRNSNGSIVNMYSQVRRVLTFNTYLLPSWLHEKLAVVFAYDYIYINGVEYQTEDAYKPEYNPRHNLSNGVINIEQVKFFNNTNNGHDAGNPGNVDTDTEGGFIIVGDDGGLLKY